MNRLERWSKRKRGLDEPHEAPPADLPAPMEAEEQSREQPLPAAGTLDDELPDPESLPPGSDFSRYLQEGVSQAFKRRALRQLWRAPHYQVRDGLDDYDDDYSRLAPLGREAAERLRPWLRRADEALTALAEETEGAPAGDPAPAPSAPDDAGKDDNASR
ncbi:DUF3306 domain-containing protein [Halomonas salifodinae]|uniref:DUF3306 domain-containing protein n=1 Tax=Halomonas salifodinae TaxID=438745 RepID=UPI0033BDBDC3